MNVTFSAVAGMRTRVQFHILNRTDVRISDATSRQPLIDWRLIRALSQLFVAAFATHKWPSWLGLTGVATPPPLFKKPTTLGWFFSPVPPQCWRGFGLRCEGRSRLELTGFGPTLVLCSRPFSVSAKDAAAPPPAMTRVSGSLFVN